MNAVLTAEQMQILGRLDACTIANAIETFHERLRNEGFVDNSIRCLSPQLPPMVGYAATIKVRGSAPATAGPDYSYSTDWWDYIMTVPAPRVVVVQDMSSKHGLGSLLGTVHIHILNALGCVGAVTDGAVRGLPAADKLKFHLFAEKTTVSHAYLHIVEFGQPVEIGSLKIKSGDLLHGDMHGVQSIPLDIAPKIPAAAARIVAHEQEIITLCQSKDVSLDKLRQAMTKQNL